MFFGLALIIVGVIFLLEKMGIVIRGCLGLRMALFTDCTWFSYCSGKALLWDEMALSHMA